MVSKYVLKAAENDRDAVIKRGPLEPLTFHYIPLNQRTARQKEILREAEGWAAEVYQRELAVCEDRIHRMIHGN